MATCKNSLSKLSAMEAGSGGEGPAAWRPPAAHTFSMISIDVHGYPWKSADIFGYPQISMDIHGNAKKSMDFHIFRLMSMDIDG